MRRFTDFTRAKDNKISKTGFTNKDVASSLSTYESLFFIAKIFVDSRSNSIFIQW